LALRPLAAREERLHRREKQVRAASPLDDLRRAVRDLARTGEQVVAGPWTGDAIGELLYWIPFLRWAVHSTLDLAPRLVVVARPESAVWYQGFDVRTEAPSGPHRVLDQELVERARTQLAETDPRAPLQDRRLEFAPLEPPIASGQVFVGRHGADAYLAVLSGVPAVVWGHEAADAADLALAGRLAEGPFGTIEAVGSPAEARARAAELQADRATAGVT
jgi:hypothetical protein